MERWDNIAIIAFITCDVIIENIYEIKYFYKNSYKNIKGEAKDIVKRFFS